MQSGLGFHGNPSRVGSQTDGRSKFDHHLITLQEQKTMSNNFEQYLNRKRREYGEKFDASDLAQQFVRYYESGQRIRVKFNYGEELTGTIGITSGWRPAFLLMRTSRSIGSPWLLGKDDQIVEVTKYQGRSR